MILARGGGTVQDKPEAQIGHRRVAVPWWVSRTVHSRSQLRLEIAMRSPVTVLPRVQSYDTEVGGHACHACRCPAQPVESLRRLDTALSELASFWRDLKRLFKEYMLGDQGVSKEMQEILEHMRRAWCLEDVARLPDPEPHHCHAVSELYKHLKPDLKRRGFPPPAWGMTPALQEWPNQRGLLHYYQVWWRQVHKAAQGQRKSEWWQTEGLQVQPLVLPPWLQQLGRTLAARLVPAGSRGPCRRAMHGQRSSRRRSLPLEAMLIGLGVCSLGLGA